MCSVWASSIYSTVVSGDCMLSHICQRGSFPALVNCNASSTADSRLKGVCRGGAAKEEREREQKVPPSPSKTKSESDSAAGVTHWTMYWKNEPNASKDSPSKKKDKPQELFEEISCSSSLSMSPSCSPHAMPEKAICTSCGTDIVDKYLLKVNDMCWHVRCLSCSVCQTSLGRHISCYIKEKEIFCKLDYFRKYGTRCAHCGRNIHSNDWVRRAKGNTYHLACFACFSCKRQLSTGEEFALVDERVLCRVHYDCMLDNLKRAMENGKGVNVEGAVPSEQELNQPKPAKRARTSFTADQLQACNASPVWFQNCRARHKKHVSPNHSSTAPVSSLQSARLSPPLMDELQYTAFAPVDTPMLTALHSYMDVHSPTSLVLQPLLPHSMTQLPISHA
ncbi:hypothetical protein DNTS_007099 [Danionella cerebrum]|uniref:LIM zinc-binding domain-containing protein n=2 Tax=Cyprinoidei TaxID=30727 RepID=A0A553QCA5_9TELE|nr:hypothetical protein DNTS_007099 [Danionella translucida]